MAERVGVGRGSSADGEHPMVSAASRATRTIPLSKMCSSLPDIERGLEPITQAFAMLLTDWNASGGRLPS